MKDFAKMVSEAVSDDVTVKFNGQTIKEGVKMLEIVSKIDGSIVWSGTHKEYIEQFNGGLDEDNKKNYIVVEK